MKTSESQQNGARIMAAFAQLTKIGMILGSIAIGAVGTYYSIRADLDSLREDLRRLHDELEAHDSGFNHAGWFSGDRILHSSLSRGIDSAIDLRERAEDRDLHARYRQECLDRWKRFAEVNAALKIPSF